MCALSLRHERECRGKRLDPSRPRSNRNRPDAAVDLGNEPPLSVDGGTGGVIDRRRISVQWFSGTILTGVCGAALMGGAVFASLDGETNFATMPERIESTLRGAIGALNDKFVSRKSDRLPAATESSAQRQVLRISNRVRLERAAVQCADAAGRRRRRRRSCRRSAGRGG
jgi:hypothetical protein